MVEPKEMIFFKNSKGIIFFVLLAGYHFFFTLLTWNYFTKNDGDAAFYWFQIPSSASKKLIDLGFFGSDFILRLNYPFAQLLNFDIRFGFLLYSCIGLLGILQFYRLLWFYIGNQLHFFGFNILPMILFLPNLHFWTAMLGKEALCFFCIATFLLELSKGRYLSKALLFSAFFLILIRPHIALLFLFSVFCCYFIYGNWKPKTKFVVSFFAAGLFFGLFYLFLQLSKIGSFDIDKIRYYNRYSLLSFQNSTTYVPIIEYSYPYKLITFYFRPLFSEVPTVYGMVLGLENVLLLVLHLYALFLLVVHYKKMNFPMVLKIISVFVLISGILIVQRYSGFGIFARTKIMMQPFFTVVLLWVLVQAKNNNVSKGIEKT